MIPLIPLVIAGGALVVARKQRQRQSLSKKLLQFQPKTIHQTDSTPMQTQPSGLLATLRTYFSLWDMRYQALIQHRLDPLLLGKTHSQQLQVLHGGAVRELSRQEINTNRRLVLGGLILGLLPLTKTIGLPIVLAVIALGLYSFKPSLLEAWRLAVKEHRFSLLHLILIYLTLLWFGGHLLVGAVGVIFLNLNRKVELLVQNVTRHKLTHLLGEQPQTVWIQTDGCEVEVPFAELRINDILILNAGQPIPVDGIIINGSAMIDQHRLTGESQAVEKTVGDRVLAATLVLGGRLEMRVEKTGAETAAAKIAEVLNQTVERQEVRIADRFRELESTRWPMLAGGVLGWVFAGPTTAAALMGCNYLMSMVPLRLLTLLNGLKTGAEQGVLIKDGRALECIPEVDTIVFDKTGTLTLEQPSIVAIHCANGYTETEILIYAAAAEQHQSHPIAQAILCAAAARKLTFPTLKQSNYQLGLGLTAQIYGFTIKIGSERFLTQEGITFPDIFQSIQSSAAEQGNALIYIAVNDEVNGVIELTAALRPEALEVIQWFKQQGLKLYIVSGDQEAPTRNISEQLGMDGYFANTLPEQKAVRIQTLQNEGCKVCFIGDGINDAIALRQANVSISLKGATTVATDAAQVVLMDAHLTQLIVLWELARNFENSLITNTRLARQFSLAAITGVIFLPFKFWIVELLWGSQALTGLKIANQALLKSSKSKC